MPKNTQVKLASRPKGLPTRDNWSIEHPPTPELEEGQILVENQFISLDPAMRGWISEVRSYLPPVELGAVMRAGAIGKVLESKNDLFKPGEIVNGMLGVQRYAVSAGKGLFKIPPSPIPLSNYLGVLGITGFTAYFGLLDIGKPKEGETVLISGAAGAVGSVVGQIARIKGCRVVGIAGGKAKCDYLINELGFDDAIDYKDESIYAGIKRTCPKGIDVFFDNVGGEILDAALARLNIGARIPICGGISQYNAIEAPRGPANYLALISCRARMEGFLVFDYAQRYGEAAIQLGAWMAEGKIKSRETVVEGIESFPDTFLKLFTGDKKGKLVIKV